MKKVTLTTFEAACKTLGIEATLPQVTGVSEAQVRRFLAEYQLDIIHQATPGAVPITELANNKLKYTGWLWFNPSRGAFDCSLTNFTYTYTILGARFWFADPNTAREFTKENIDLINDMML
jgi:hypothetical protein